MWFLRLACWGLKMCCTEMLICYTVIHEDRKGIIWIWALNFGFQFYHLQLGTSTYSGSGLNSYWYVYIWSFLVCIIVWVPTIILDSYVCYRKNVLKMSQHSLYWGQGKANKVNFEHTQVHWLYIPEVNL